MSCIEQKFGQASALQILHLADEWRIGWGAIKIAPWHNTDGRCVGCTPALHRLECFDDQCPVQCILHLPDVVVYGVVGVAVEAIRDTLELWRPHCDEQTAKGVKQVARRRIVKIDLTDAKAAQLRKVNSARHTIESCSNLVSMESNKGIDVSMGTHVVGRGRC